MFSLSEELNSIREKSKMNDKRMMQVKLTKNQSGFYLMLFWLEDGGIKKKKRLNNDCERLSMKCKRNKGDIKYVK